MPVFCGVTLSDQLLARVQPWAVDAGIPLGLLAGLVWWESRGVAGICGDFDWQGDSRSIFCPAKGGNYCSWGLLQLNVCGGQGTGMTIAQLTDPETNLSVGVPPIALAFRRHGTNWWETLQASGHPGSNPSPELTAAWQPAVDLIACLVPALEGYPGTPAPPPPPPVATVLTGTVSSAGRALAGAVVTAFPEQRAALTGAGGGYSLAGLLAGEHLVTVSAPGHTAASFVVTLAAGTNILNVALNPLVPGTLPLPPPAPPLAAGSGLLLAGVVAAAAIFALSAPRTVIVKKKPLPAPAGRLGEASVAAGR